MAILKTIKIEKASKARVVVNFNTGTSRHKPKKGAGSYSRKNFKLDY